tara:strand:- start:2534 stop:2845 length:312 start_codon:yes stop_codon:yes gene_type:complete
MTKLSKQNTKSPELIIGEFIDVAIDIHILRQKVSNERLNQIYDVADNPEVIVDCLWKQIYVALERKSELENSLITMGVYAREELTELENEMIERFYEQHTEEL